MRIISIVGLKNAGKTTLLVALAREFHRRGKRLATIKHATQPVEIDRQGTDSWRHLNEGLADGVLVASPDLRVVVERRSDDTGPEALAHRYFADRDLVLVEAFQRSDLPKIEIYRLAVGPSPLIKTAGIEGPWVAVVSDTAIADTPCPVLRFTDTMWLQLLAALAWDHAKPIDP
ncbi:MAG: molybdopterin-guanine dinucleotide biosynthesis protein B [Gemmatimonadetes bacterium]|nr:molybdopterin-guanine dinucleotide biosynthesis protein B [Gemmatimonadota bacterium]